MSEPAALQGSAEHFSLGALLQLVEEDLFTGKMRVGAASVSFFHGAPVAAECNHLSGVHALLEMFPRWRGRFQLTEQPIAVEEPLGPVIRLVMQGYQLVDEWSRLSPMVLQLKRPPQSPSAEVAKLLALFDGEQSLHQLATKHSLAICKIAHPVQKLYESKSLRKISVVEVTTEPEEALDYYTAIERGRTLLRGGDVQGSVLAFEAALRARPDDRVASQNLRRARARAAANPSQGLPVWQSRRS